MMTLIVIIRIIMIKDKIKSNLDWHLSPSTLDMQLTIAWTPLQVPVTLWHIFKLTQTNKKKLCKMNIKNQGVKKNQSWISEDQVLRGEYGELVSTEWYFLGLRRCTVETNTDTGPRELWEIVLNNPTVSSIHTKADQLRIPAFIRSGWLVPTVLSCPSVVPRGLLHSAVGLRQGTWLVNGKLTIEIVK